MSRQLQIAVIGAGIIGLSTAYKIQLDMPSVGITIFYEERTPKTTGNVSAGLILPYSCSNDKIIDKWFNQTMSLLETLHKRPDAIEMGITPTSGYIFGNGPFQFQFIPDNVQLIRENEAQFLLGNNSGIRFTSWTCDCSRYLKYLEGEYLRLEGKMIQRKILNFGELKSYDIIVNCAGMGAKQLTNDKELMPIRGQVIVVEAPWVKHFFVRDNFYVLPRLTDVVLGGTKQIGNYSLNVDPSDNNAIWQGCCELVPSLKYSKIVTEEVGLRPYRKHVRIELETVNFGDESLAVVHNYGHGGAGVSLHWGCAIDASKLVQQFLDKQPISHKL